MLFIYVSVTMKNLTMKNQKGCEDVLTILCRFQNKTADPHPICAPCYFGQLQASRQTLKLKNY